MSAQAAIPIRVRLFVAIVATGGLAAIVWAALSLVRAPLHWWAVLLAIATLVSSRFVISVPGQPASVSISEVFVFASTLLFGPAPAVLTVAADGLWVSCRHRDRRWYRTVFNVAEPAVSTVVAGAAFFVVAGVAPFATERIDVHGQMLAAAVMSLAYFLSNTGLQAAAVAVENRLSPFEVWRQHAWYVGINDVAAGSLALLAVRNGSGVDLEVVGLVAPLLLLSYAAYKAAASRIDDAHQHVHEIQELYKATVETLAIAVDAKDQVTHGHIRRVQRHTLAVARALGIVDPTQLKGLEAASLLHDIGKLAVPDYILNKPGALTVAEFEYIKQHATMGATILSTVDFPYVVVPIVRHHHEQWSGHGYPDRIAGTDIPLGARIVSVVDCFDALTSDRPYRRRLTDSQAIAIIQERRGTMYDPDVVDRFIAMIPELRRQDAAIDGEIRAALPAAVVIDREAGNIGAALTDEQIARISNTLRQTAPAIADGSEACFYAHVASGEALAAVAWTDRLENVVAGRTVPLADGLVGWVAAHRHTIVNSHADLDLGDAAEPLNLAVCTAVPVFAFGTLAGVLTFYLGAGLQFTTDDVRRLGILGQRIGLTLLGAEELDGVGRASDKAA
jgi:putative nucleotidyltransferase with HDIG domain